MQNQPLSSHSARLEKARQVYSARAAARKYVVTWRGGGAVQCYQGTVGLAQLAAMLGITVHSLKCYLSKGRGTHTFNGINPTLEIQDIATITRIDPPAKPKRARGRPRKQADTARMGVEFGTNLAPPAKTMPKTRNRRTDEKP